MSLPSFGVRNPVPVNLLMAAIFFAGAVSGIQLRRAFFPEVDPEAVMINAPYPGADPQEVEETLVIKIEDALRKLDEVDEITTSVVEGGAGVTAELVEGTNPDKALDEIERKIRALQDLPQDSEEITMQLMEPRLPVIRVAVYGDLDDRLLKEGILGLRDELRDLPKMGEIFIDGMREDELRIEIRHEDLIQRGVSLPQVADTIRAWMQEVPGGSVKGGQGNTRIRTKGYAEAAEAVRQIPVVTRQDGSVIRLEQLASIEDGFVDDLIINRFNGESAAVLTVYKVGNQDIVKMANRVRSYIDGRNGEPLKLNTLEKIQLALHKGSKGAVDKPFRLEAWETGANSRAANPAGMRITPLSDLARFVEGRLDLLLRNASLGAVLVFGVLLLVLNWRAAIWVGVGLVIALLGTLVLMSWLDVTLNLLTMFGLIVVIGLLVDDAIVVAENIQARHERGEPALDAAINGAEQVLWPVVATVLTSIVAFLPLTFIKGNIGDLLGALPVVVAIALMMSLLESLLILPAHMGHTLAKRDKQKNKRPGLIAKYEKARDQFILHTMVPKFGNLLDRLLSARYLTLTVMFAIFLGTTGLVQGKRVIFEFMSSNDAETITVELEMPVGTNIGRTNEQVDTIEQAAALIPEVQSIASQVGQTTNVETGNSEASASHIAQIFIELLPTELRDRESSKVINDLRQRITGKLQEVERISYQEISGGPGGADIQLKVFGDDQERATLAINDLKRELTRIQGVVDVRDNHDAGQQEISYTVSASGAALGFTNADVARQVRGYLFGIDAHVYAQNEEDIDVRVRVDEETRQSLFALENAWLISPEGLPVPLMEVADRKETSTYATIRRIDGKRTVSVFADTAPDVSPEEATRVLTEPQEGESTSTLTKLRAKYPGISIEFSGRQEQMGEAFESLPVGFMAAAVGIYVILAWLFKSYFQPFVVMSCIPFATIGMIWGHYLLGYNMTFLSLIGFVALAGIVVNDSLILVEFYNHERQRGLEPQPALVSAGRNRLRAILLTTITTVLGLTPLILEQSFQAKFLIPMGISIAGGLISATVVILVAVPCMMLVLEDIKSTLHFAWHGRKRALSIAQPRVEIET